jgi:PAS domain S-box-containing protein
MSFIPSELARSALDAAPDAMIITDRSGMILFANRQVSALFGYARDQIIGRSIEQLIPERPRERHARQGEQRTNGVPARRMGAEPELFGRREDGTEFPLEISSSPVHAGGHAFIAVIRNVVARRLIEAAPIVAREDAGPANLSRGRFFATCHDRRQPVSNRRLEVPSLTPPSLTPPARSIAVRVLLVEDDAAVRDSTSLLLRVEGYQVTAVASLAQALHVAREHECPDLLVTDHYLSEGGTGTEVIEMLRERFGAAMKALLITAETSTAVKELPRDPHLRIANSPMKADLLLELIEELLTA